MGKRNQGNLLGCILAGSLVLAVFGPLGCSTGGKQQTAQPSEQPQAPRSATLPQVGGEEIVRLVRKATSGGSKPEFVSVTILPGRGMNVFQITADIPGKGEIPLISSPAVEDAARVMNGTGKDQYGNASHSFGGAFLIPYPNRIRGDLSPDGKIVTVHWRGRTMTIPANFPKQAIHGLILAAKVGELQTQTTEDGQTETGVLHAGSFGGHWLSETDLTFTIALTGDAVEETVTAKNVGKDLEPMAIGQHPYFAIPSGDRSQARIHIPAQMMALTSPDEFPTGQLKPVRGTEFDYQSSDGVPLDDHARNVNYSHLTRTKGVVDAWLTDPKSNYGIRIEGLSPEIRTVQLYSRLDKSFAAIEEQFNYPDPFGVEWRGMDTGMVTLRPGQSVTWKQRLELFAPEAP
jgi:aldose 1-epimerase